MSATPLTFSTPIAHNALPLPSSTPVGQSLWIAPHSHIKSLGLHPEGFANVDGAEFVWQVNAREACSVVVDLVKCCKFSGRALLLVSAPGTGKTVLALAISPEFWAKVPLYLMVGSEVYSTEVKKTEVLAEAFWQVIGLCIKETKEVYEDKVTELTPTEAENPLSGYGKTVLHVIVSLKTVKGTKQLRLNPFIYEAILKKKIVAGDVIYIKVNTSAVKLVGRSDTYTSSYNFESETYVPLLKGEVHKQKELVQDVTLGDLDAVNARPQGGQDMSVMGSLMKSGRMEVTEKLRKKVNKVVRGYVDQSVAKVVPGVIFIDEILASQVHMLNIECFTYLNALPKGNSIMRGTTDIVAPHGIPYCCLIFKTDSYTNANIAKIMQVLANIEGLKLGSSVLEQLAMEGKKSLLQ
ncbi:uncharacterized protein PHACADRAFT_167633 [Phanerochaete carnosa HHB-10118-sp]|uniref:RuvB-like helicase n=1 Tax=Phanerochaete carnosa (strain HHB-10118-sp) TaxID=650164 RepID=K5XB82_PHACS|nr:uncharacterized protein PHACADRAFT_167633 [Phanerochaete carnosa HHB-10118-sp]EKM60207.1 hypothetical protein PHACADRAFT_167633 [Phanerochaete carnosa HHB-10118-sp]